MKIGMIGSGNVGQVLTQLFVQAGNEVVIAHRGSVDALEDLARVLGAEAGTVEQAEAQEIVVLAVPFWLLRLYRNHWLKIRSSLMPPIIFLIAMRGLLRLNVIKKRRLRSSPSIFNQVKWSKLLIQLG